MSSDHLYVKLSKTISSSFTRMLTYYEKERICENTFEANGPFWHLYTDGTTMQNIFLDETDFDTAMAVLAVSRCRSDDVEMLTFEIMNNHLHIIASGKRERCLLMFAILKDKLRRVMSKMGRTVSWDKFIANIIPIPDLKALRNEIIYAHRNAFVADSRHTPYSYAWGGGCAYFNPIINELSVTSFGELSYDKKRKLTHSRDIDGLSRLKFVKDRVYIPSFCNIKLGEAMFTDARQYFYGLTRNAETFSQIAERLKDKIFLTDDEMYQAAVQQCETEFQTRQLATLAPEQKIALAKTLHFKYKASNQQLRRLLKLDMVILSELFPTK